MKHRAHNERGAALVVALLGMVVIGGLVTAAFTTTWLEFRLSDNARRSGQAFAAADLGLAATIDNWAVGAWNSMPVLDSVAVNGSSAGGSGSYDGYVKRIADDMFLVEITGKNKFGTAQQRVGEFVRLSPIQADIQSALTVQGPTTIGGSAQIVGADSVPSGWTGCPTPDSNSSMGGVRLPDASNLTTQGGCSGAACISGDPAVDVDPSVNDSTFNQFGDLDWATLISYATTIPIGTYSQIDPVVDAQGDCNLAVITNWGDPLNAGTPCSEYFPLIYVPGTVKLTGNVGQGMLLVEGDLEVSGGFEFYGVAIVRGRLSSTGTGGHFNGAVMAQNVDLEDNKILGSALIQYSSCSASRALKAAAPADRLPSRGWIYTQ